MYHNILLVDDETHVTEALSSLLRAQADIECEVFTASSAPQALEIAQRERIDLMISDICMPDQSGFDLVKTMRTLWPVCQVIMLTGYSDFENAYRAFQLNVDGFLLKTEDDDQILLKIRDVLNMGKKLLEQGPLLADDTESPPGDLDCLLGMNDQSRMDALSEHSIKVSGKLILCLCNTHGAQAAAIDKLIRHYMSARVSGIFALTSAKDPYALWLFQDLSADITPLLISNMMETVNHSYFMTTGESFSCVIAPAAAKEWTQVFAELKEQLEEANERRGSIAVSNPMQHNSAEYAVRFVKRYIREHMTDDVTVATLAGVTGYNADYLARIFRAQSGQTIGQYIINERIGQIKALMRQDELSLEEIAQMTGFSSRAYFNRFIKRVTGFSPRLLRLRVQQGEV